MPWPGTESEGLRLEWSAGLSPGLSSGQTTQIWTVGQTVNLAEADQIAHLTAVVVEVVVVMQTVEAGQWRKVEN